MGFQGKFPPAPIPVHQPQRDYKNAAINIRKADYIE